MDLKSTTVAILALDACENHESPGSNLSSNFLSKAALSGFNV